MADSQETDRRPSREIRSLRPSSGPPDVDRLRKRCFAIMGEAKLTDRADRHDLASFILGRKIRSWNEFNLEDWQRMTDALCGWFSVQELRRQKGLDH